MLAGPDIFYLDNNVDEPIRNMGKSLTYFSILEAVFNRSNK